MSDEKSMNAFIADIVAAKLEIKHAVLDKTNPHFRSKYASLASTLDAAVHVYAKHNITIEQRRVRKDDGSWVLRTWMRHVSGEQDEIPDEQTLDEGSVQQRGSSLTYNRRYGLSTVAGIASEDDDDGEEAMREKPAKKGKADARPDYTAMAEAADMAETRTALDTAWRLHRDLYDAMPDDWKKHIRDHYARVKESLPE